MAALVLLFKNIRSPESNTVKQYLLILYQGLRPNRFYWEFVNTLRKILIFVAFLLSTSQTIFISLLVLVVSGVFQSVIKPYKREENNKAELMATYAGVSTVCASLVYQEEDQINNLNNLVLLSIMFMNIAFWVEWTYLLATLYEEKYRLAEYIANVLAFISCKRCKEKEIRRHKSLLIERKSVIQTLKTEAKERKETERRKTLQKKPSHYSKPKKVIKKRRNRIMSKDRKKTNCFMNQDIPVKNFNELGDIIEFARSTDKNLISNDHTNQKHTTNLHSQMRLDTLINTFPIGGSNEKKSVDDDVSDVSGISDIRNTTKVLKKPY